MLHETALRERISELEEEVRQLRQINATRDRQLEEKFRLSPVEGRILRILAKGGVCSREKLTFLACREDSTDQVISVHVFKIRRKIAPLEIRNIRLTGYALEGESLAAIRKLIAGGA